MQLLRWLDSFFYPGEPGFYFEKLAPLAVILVVALFTFVAAIAYF